VLGKPLTKHSPNNMKSLSRRYTLLITLLWEPEISPISHLLHLFCSIHLEWMYWIFLFAATIMWCAICTVITNYVSLCLLWYSYTARTCLCSVCRLLLCIHPLSPSASWVDSGESALCYFTLRHYTIAYMTKYNII